MKLDNDIPIAPLLYGGDLNEVNPKVIVHLMAGTKIKGRLKELNGPLQFIFILKENNDLLKIAFNDLRYLLFQDAHNYPTSPHPLEAYSPSVLTPDSTYNQEFKINFLDGKILRSKICGSIQDEYCLHFFQITAVNKIIRGFVPFVVIQKYQIGPLIGQILLKNKVIDRNVLNAAVKTQDIKLTNHEANENVLSDPAALKRVLIQHMSPVKDEDPISVENKRELEEGKLEDTLLIHKKEHKRLGEVLQSADNINNEEIYIALAQKFGLPFVNLHQFDIDPTCVDYLPQELARSLHAMPLIFVKNHLVAAVDDPASNDVMSMLRFVSGHYIELVVATETDIDWAIHKYYGTMEDEEIQEIINNGREDSDETVEEETDYRQAGLEKPIVRLVHNMILDAIHKKASDIHIRPAKDYVTLIYRINGTLIKMRKFSKTLLPALVSRIKILGKMNISEKRLPQDGRSQYVGENVTVDLRISIMPTVDGESVVIRILNSEAGVKTIKELGFGENDQAALLDMLHKTFGLFLVTGPTGSGKSTTLYAALKEIQRQNVNIITVEDPVEYHMEGIEQIQINAMIGYNFARALRNILRHDPDVIMVGEIRDEATAKIAVESALTGHLVLSTLHTNDAPSTIARLLEMGVEPYLLNTCLLGVLAQRLVKKNCQYCTKEETIGSDIRKILNVPNDEVFYQGAGCDECNNTGYSGRLGVYELLVINDAIRKLVHKDVTADEIRKAAIQEGMTPLTQNTLAIARKRVISLSEVYRVRLT